MSQRIYTIEEIAEILKVHRTYVASLIKDNKLAALKIGRFYRIREDQLETLIGGKLVAILTIDDVAETLKIHRTYVARLIKQNKLKAIKIGKFYRIREDDFNAFLEESEV
jgi:excisionase family DNA binding protein